ncbi:hypothetical protein K501DRAFT_256083 [Backusella circina FSU 941]|nr:hypothetical protein K501DRAFT_256083 [Backusella circina FSU 941]
MKKLFLINILFTLTSSTYAQSCLSLQGSKACPALQQYYISTQNFNYLINVTNVNQLDDALFNYATSPDLYLNPLGCPNNDQTNIPYARYSLTYLCESLLQDSDYSLPCNYNLNLSPPPLCQSTCFQYVQSINQSTDAISTCPNQSYQQQQIQAMNVTCQSWSGLNGTGNCILGMANEPDNCGFSSQSEACQYCKTNQQDACCANVNHCKTFSGGAIAGIVIGIIVFFGVIAAGLIYYRKKRRLKYQQKENIGYKSMGSQRRLQTSSEPKLLHDDEEGGGVSAQQDDIQEEFYQVQHAYPSQMTDELGLYVGDIVCVAMHFDDGWALGFNVTTGLKGVFPVVCVTAVPQDQLEQLLHNQPSPTTPPPLLPEHQELSSKILIEEEQEPLNRSNIPRRNASIRYQQEIIESIEQQKNPNRVSKLEEN